ncbi:hypothetical protein FO519_000384 [Halicephalobus sp. NKZ332]|nr:hypothetical protein FO519_000384 [Halicephalobus sp. NKZ332]
MDAILNISNNEPQDAVIDEGCYWENTNLRGATKSTKLFIGNSQIRKESLLSKISKFFENHSFQKRLEKFEEEEIKTFVAQKLFKIDGIVCDEETRTMLVDQMICSIGKSMLSEERLPELRIKYGPELAEWAFNRLQHEVVGSSDVLRKATAEYKKFKDVDPLLTWHKLRPNERTHIVSKIQEFSYHMTQMVKFSLLIDPGHIRCHLSTFIDEFNDLEELFDCVELESEELSQKAFDANYLSKARNSKLECVDMSRVILRLPEYLTDANQTAVFRRAPADIFGEMDCPQINSKTDYPNVEALQMEEVDKCPVYWPKLMGEELQFGSLVVRNHHVNGVADPLFTITELAIFHADHPQEVLYIQHWQWDWRDYRDYHWPLRLLQRSRISPRPTVIHCLDGCGRTGTLVLIEVMLMQLLRGSINYDYPMLTCASFVRLQRRHAVANHIQYLFAYRVVLHWLQPYVNSYFQRFRLGFMLQDSGFVGKFDEVAQNWARKVAPR